MQADTEAHTRVTPGATAPGIDLNGLRILPEDVDHSHYFPKYPEKQRGWLARLLFPGPIGPMLTLELTNRQRYLFEGELADHIAEKLTQGGIPVFRHKV
jgi:hypothetical protein